MALWLCGASFVLVVTIFDSPAIDYRLVMAAAALPLVEHLFDGPWVMQTLLFPVGVLTAVMLATRGRRLVRRRWLGLPIGFLLYLVLSGAWTRTELFWWPVFGPTVPTDGLPELPSVAVIVALDLLGVAALAWSWRRWGLADERRRRLFLREGRLDRALMSQPPPTC